MQKEILLNVLEQNRMTSSFAFEKISAENAEFRLNEKTASARFIFRHIAETIHLFGQFLGTPTDVQNTTIGETDKGQGEAIAETKALIESGYQMLRDLIENMPDEEWLEIVETPFFGSVPRIRLFSHALFHTSDHTGQISLILAKGQKF